MILDFIILYKMILDNILEENYDNFLEYHKNKTNNTMTTYTPSLLNDIYKNIK